MENVIEENRAELVQYLDQYLTDERKSLFESKLDHRTNFLQVVLEDVFQPQNASAVVRTCDCLGIQQIHTIEDKFELTYNRDVTKGAGQWVQVERYKTWEDPKRNTRACLQQLKDQGIRIAATAVHGETTDLLDYEVNQPTAIVFGTEQTGISDTVKEMADDFITIPMHGFTESYNLSVAAAMTVFELMRKIRNAGDAWQLTEKERIATTFAWQLNTIKRPELLIEHFLKMDLNNFLHLLPIHKTKYSTHGKRRY